MGQPLVSVVMPVHNAAPFLDASITSILEQTHRDFEFVILDDGSTDGSRSVLEVWARRDPRIHLLTLERQLGPVESSNVVARAAHGVFLARMDADDISHPSRLERELAALAEREGTALVGTLLECMDTTGRTVRPRDRSPLLRRSTFAPFPHGSIVVPRALFLEVGGYREECAFWEDLDLYHRLARRGRVLVIPEALYRSRFHAGSTRLVHEEAQVERAISNMFRCMRRVRETGTYNPAPHASQNGHLGIPRPYVLYSLAASRFWAGAPPGLWERLSVRDLVPPTPGVIAIFAFALWGRCHHPSLRVAMRALVRGRT